MLHPFLRTEMLIGTKGLEKLNNATVAIFGLGGVGSYAAEGLVRAGVGGFVLVDVDYICITNLNRQIHATLKTIGRPKVEVMRERILDINPKARIEIYQVFYDENLADQLIRNNYSYIVDAIDTVNSKVDLIVQAKRMGIPIISSMGMGNKICPDMLEIEDIFSTSVCPLAKIIRKELRKKGIDSLKVVYSKEKPIKPIEYKSADFDKSFIKKDSPPGSISFVPSVAGLMIAGEVVKDLLGL